MSTIVLQKVLDKNNLSVAPQSGALQLLSYPGNYFKQSHIDILCDPNTELLVKCSIVADAFRKNLRLESMNEKTLRALLSYIAACHWPQGSPDHQSRYYLSETLRGVWKGTLEPNMKLPRLIAFPHDPSGLSETLYQHAYTDETYVMYSPPWVGSRAPSRDLP